MKAKLGLGVAILVMTAFFQPLLAEVPEGAVSSRRSADWSSHWNAGLWYNRYDVTKTEGRFQQPGLLSLNLGLESRYDFHPIYLGFNADLYTPQIVWKSVGLGVFYLFCFIFTGGSCDVDASFGTGDRDSGMIDAGAALGVNFAEFSQVPVRFYAGADFGIFHSAFTPRPYSTFFVKSGIAYDLDETYAVDLSVKRSVWMRQWDFGSDNGVYDPSLWVLTVNFVMRR